MPELRSTVAHASALPPTLREASTKLRDRAISAVELTARCLARIAGRNPALNAFITVTADLAREQAAAADAEITAGRWKGPLHGVPVAVKDFFDTAGVRSTAAFAPFENRVPRRDAELVNELREAGAVLVGKTNMHQLGSGTTSLVSHFRPVVNPLDRRRVAGGSSGGSAAAVAAGLCYATIDTDAIGSARLPAACCGVASFKPTYGRLSTAGILADQPPDETIVRLAHAAVTARTVEDIAFTFAALTGAGVAAPPRADRAPTIAVVRNARSDGRARAVLLAVTAFTVSLGWLVTEVDVPFDDASFDVSRVDEARAGITARLFAAVDFLLLPTLVGKVPTVATARRKGELAVSPDNTFFCNYYGLPSISIPFSADDGGLPVSVQIVGPPEADDAVLGAARAVASSPSAFVRALPSSSFSESSKRGSLD
jgi:aspartyl-tRNA(Asn)/glutamyl-tRNA(Gln) amidotransferase subunit A